MKEIRLNLFGYPDLSFFLINLLMGVGNDKWVDRKNKASSDCSVNVFWDASGREMVERS